MAEPSYKKRLRQLEALLDDQISLFARLKESEQQLQQQLITGDLQALHRYERERLSIKQELVEMEKRHREMVPEGTALSTYIRTTIPRSQQALLLNKTELITEELVAVKTVHTVNQSLMEVSLRFSKELQRSLRLEIFTYDGRGKLSENEKKPRRRLDYNC